MSSGIWKNRVFSMIPDLNYIYDFRFVSNENETYFSYINLNPKTMSRFIIDVSGQLKQLNSFHSYQLRSEPLVQRPDLCYLLSKWHLKFISLL